MGVKVEATAVIVFKSKWKKRNTLIARIGVIASSGDTLFAIKLISLRDKTCMTVL